MKIRVITIILIAIVTIGCKKHIGSYTPQDGPLKVSTMVLDVDNSGGISHSYIGTCEANANANLSFPTGGKVTKVCVKASEKVHAGQLLAEIDAEQAKNALDVAQATYNQAKDGYERAKKVYDEGGISEVQWKDIETQLSKAESMLKMAQENLNNCQITAPFDGVIGSCDLTIGQHILPGQTAMEMLDIHNICIRFDVPENEVCEINVGQEIDIQIAIKDNAILRGKIIEKDLTYSKLSHSYPFRAAIIGNHSDLLPGMVCKAIITSPNADNVFVLPASCIQIRPEGKSVWLMVDGKAHRQTISVGEFVKNGVVVLDGLKHGDCVVTQGYQKLTEGAEITNE